MAGKQDSPDGGAVASAFVDRPLGATVGSPLLNVEERCIDDDGSPSRRRLVWLGVVALLAAFCWRIAETPVPVVVGALAPAAAYALLVTFVGGRRSEAGFLVGAFLWGAVVAASAASTGNSLLQAWMSVTSSARDASVVVPRLGAPIVEELAKGAALVVLVALWPSRLARPSDGIVYGALVGLGFAASENLLYLTLAALQGGYPGLLRNVFLRGATYGLNHAVFTAFTGAAIGYARLAPSRLAAIFAPLAGFAVAVVVHVIWNVVASDAITRALCAAPAAGAACQDPPPARSLYVTVPLVVALFVAPCIAALVGVVRLADDGSS